MTKGHAFNRGFVLWLARTYFKELNPEADFSTVDIDAVIDGTLSCQENLSLLEREYPAYRWKKVSKRDQERDFRETVKRLQEQDSSTAQVSMTQSKRLSVRPSENSESAK